MNVFDLPATDDGLRCFPGPLAAAGRSNRVPARRGEDGATSTEMAVIMPILIVLVCLPVQFALWYHAKQSADTAAEECVEAAQVPGADIAADGAVGARAILSQAGNLANVTITAAAAADSVVCTVRGDLNYAIIDIGFSVRAQAEGPIEKFIAEDDR